MYSIPVSTLTESIATLLTEAYAGPPDPSATWWIDNQPDSGILGVIAKLSAAEASQPMGDDPNGTTIAANVEHLRWSLANVNTTLRGGEYDSHWSQSWRVSGASEEEWERLQQSLQAEFETLREAILQQQELEGVYLNGLLALVPHAAFHLGLIRQMAERVRG